MPYNLISFVPIGSDCQPTVFSRISPNFHLDLPDPLQCFLCYLRVNLSQHAAKESVDFLSIIGSQIIGMKKGRVKELWHVFMQAG